MRHADNRALVRYWHALRAGRSCPRRTEIDPRKINADIGHLFILEDLGRGNIRFRLAGSALVDAFWMELRGMPAHSIMAPEGREALRSLARDALGMPGIGLARLVPQDAPLRPDWEIALLPLRSEQGDVDRLLGALRPLGEWAAGPLAPPLAFAMGEMSVTPVVGDGSDVIDAGQVLAVGGAHAAFGLASARPALRAIEGGGATESAPRRPALRVVGRDD
jgi:hypothetical protein